ncbi:uncharacterized protein THITE_2147767 [Thermothielavioides terrestris NRRL 8126]|uniref:Uncharacterized protein n=1 Tax=Thermothielavioides terrestris (strain ATCC 38088 / NRRL 8126) TaxID=578455 RepID=G2RGM9_THETT|nr:uncharacterized protein THITE_2147767 [Thermothielavioides terrestris NRRL 8126]AEO71061.1 hypothetical protein THITE_2147767 [Thermothielavioides terrestris NRRL 8126]
MLRLRPTVISLAPSEVTELIHRRRFWRFLEVDGREGVGFAPAATEAAFNRAQCEPSSSPSPGRDAIPETHSPEDDRGRVPLVVDLPALLSADRPVEEDISSLSPADLSGRQEGRLDAAEQHEEGPGPGPEPSRTMRLCMRPRRGSPPPAMAATAPRDAGCSSVLHDEPGSTPATPENGADLERNEAAGFGTPSPTWSPGTSLTLAFTQVSEPDIPSPEPRFMAAGRLCVYNDLLPASSQPQTPQQLPEARRQSRLQGSYTAPARPMSPRPPWTPTTSRSRRALTRRREASPLGLQTPGFRGLYGGLENTDDDALVEQMAEEISRSVARPPQPGGSMQPS